MTWSSVCFLFFFLQCIRWTSWWALMDALTAQGSVFTAAALRRLQIDTQRLGFQLSQPADPLESHTHTHTNLQSGSQRSCWEGMTIAVVHHICSKIFGMCTRADANTKTDWESRGRLCPDKPTTTRSDVVSARPHLMTRDRISAVIIIFVCLHRKSFRVLTGTENWESPKLLRQCFYPVCDSFSSVKHIQMYSYIKENVNVMMADETFSADMSYFPHNMSAWKPQDKSIRSDRQSGKDGTGSEAPATQ